MTYSLVQYCNKARQGYLVTYINDEELERARTMTKAIEGRLVKEGFANASLTTDSIWQKASQLASGQPIGDAACHEYYRQITQASPVPAIQIEKP